MKFIKKSSPLAVSFSILLFLCSCFSDTSPERAVRKEYGSVLNRYFEDVSWNMSPEGLVEYRGRIKEGLLYGSLGIERDSFTDDKAAELFKNREFSDRLIKTFGLGTVYDMYTRNVSDLNMELTFGCCLQKEYDLSPTEEDLYIFIDSVNDKKEMKKIIAFVLEEIQKRIYKVGSLVIISFSYNDKNGAHVVSFSCPSCVPLTGECFISGLLFDKNGL